MTSTQGSTPGTPSGGRPTGGTATRTRSTGRVVRDRVELQPHATTFPGAAGHGTDELEAAARRQLVAVGRGGVAAAAAGAAAGTAGRRAEPGSPPTAP